MDVKEISLKASLVPEDRLLLVNELVAAILPHLQAASLLPAITEIQEEPSSKKEICRFLDCSEPTLTKWMAEGKIPFGRKGRRVYFFKSQVVKSLEQPLKSKTA